MNKKNLIKIFFLFIYLLFQSCDNLDLEKDTPRCINQLISDIKKDEVQNPPSEVWKWIVNDVVYYYITSGCCDKFNFLYDDECNLICAPDGGFSGMGDGKCSNLNGNITKSLVWKDERS